MSKETKKPFYQNIVDSKKKKSAPAGKKNTQKTTFLKPEKSTEIISTQKRTQNIRTFQERFLFTIEKSLFGVLSQESKRILDSFDDIVQSVRPMNSKQLQELSYAIRDLSHHLTDERSDRRRDYMNSQTELSAYIHYFQWWNLFRLVSLFSGFGEKPFSFLKDGDCLLDLGSGPLTVPISLWLSRPELRQKKLTFYVLDVSQNALSTGNDIFLSVAAQTGGEPWHIVRVKGELGTEIRQKAALVLCANMFNELLQTQQVLIEESVKLYSRTVISYCADTAAVLLIEPGVPRCGRFISLMRDALSRKSFETIAPCPHCGECPMPGTKNTKWCHFVLDTESAPKKLLKLSTTAGLPKERAVLSFIFSRRSTAAETIPQTNVKTDTLPGIITSDIIRLPHAGAGRYACTPFGLALVSGMKTVTLVSGTKFSINLKDKTKKSLIIDEKTGAVCIPLE